MPRHFRNADGVHTLRLAENKQVARGLKAVANPEAMGIMVVRGLVGTGKTYAVQLGLELLEAVQSIYVTAKPSLNPGRLCRLLGEAIEGVSWQGDTHELREDLIQLTSERPYLVAIDEAQTLTPSAIVELRTLFDDDRTRLGVVLIGSDGLEAKLAANGALASRCSRDVHFRPISTRDAKSLLPVFHPVFADAEPELLTDVNERALGRLRHWTDFAVDAEDICAERGTSLTREVAEEIWLSQGAIRRGLRRSP